MTETVTIQSPPSASAPCSRRRLSHRPVHHQQGLTWRTDNPDGNITTSDGAARTGDWGFFAYPHGSYASNGINGLDCSECGDGFSGVIGTAGFSSFEYRDLEGTLDEMKYLFADDFYFAGTATVVPVPAAIWLFESGIPGLFGCSFKRERMSQQSK